MLTTGWVCHRSTPVAAIHAVEDAVPVGHSHDPIAEHGHVRRRPEIEAPSIGPRPGIEGIQVAVVAADEHGAVAEDRAAHRAAGLGRPDELRLAVRPGTGLDAQVRRIHPVHRDIGERSLPGRASQRPVGAGDRAPTALTLAPGVGELACGELWQAAATTTSNAIKGLRPRGARCFLVSMPNSLPVITVWWVG